MSSKKKSHCIGKGRRLTLKELQSVASGEATVEWYQPGADNADDAPPPSSDVFVLDETVMADRLAKHDNNTSSSDDDCLSAEETVASLTLLALNISQGRLMPSTAMQEEAHLVQAIIILVQTISNNATAVRLPRDATALWSALPSFILVQPTSADQCFLWKPENATAVTAMVDRVIWMAANSLAVTRAVSLAQVALPVAALSVERYGALAVLDEYAERRFDQLRPHRGLITAAAALRAILNQSKYGSDQPAPAAALQAVKDLPQYHGPAQETLQQAHKTLELELNCFDVALTERPLDRTVAELAVAQAAQAVQVLTRASQVRVDSDGTPELQDDTNLFLPRKVVALQTALQSEARTTAALLQKHMDVATEQARQKEAAKAERAAALQPQQPSDQDEFAGKSEAQKAKILAARAKKEAKAKAKAAAKQAKQGGDAVAVALFGTGTHALLPLFQADDYQLSKACIGQVQTLLDQLLSGGVQRKPKIPKGTRDYLPDQMRIRQTAFNIIRRVFQSHGAVEIDTPVFELKDTLTGKYGEDSKLIYDLADQGGELLALRYDLTVPFARFLALNSVGNIKRYHIGKVYRRDQPALSRGRYREFYQCDFDIAGVYGRMVADSECLCVVCEILDSLDIGDFGIKLNHRRLLDAILDICGVPAEKFRTICSAVDKLDKEPWEAVKREMVDEKGLDSEVADKIGTFVLNKGEPKAMYKELMESKKFGNHEGAMAALEDLRIVFEYLEAMDKLKFISFDLSLARGLDYYTGVIYEAVCMSGNTQVGSIGGGGRYDNLVSMFQEAGKQTPCVGVSVGIERVFTLMEAKLREEQGGSIKKPNVDVVVASIGDGMLTERMRLAKILWDAKISAEYSQQESPKLNAQLRNALDREIPFMLIIGEQELAENKCKVKDLKANEEELVPIVDAVKALRRRGVIPVGCEFAAELEAL